MLDERRGICVEGSGVVLDEGKSNWLKRGVG